MTATRPQRLFPLAAALAVVASPTLAWAGQASPDALTPTTLQDPEYGDVLFRAFADDPFGSLVRLESAQALDRIPHHEAEAELLAGGLYLSLGLRAEAARRFDRLLAGSVPTPVGDRALFYLARISYEHGSLDEAWGQLQRIHGPLPGELEGDRRLLECNVLMALGRFDEAALRLRAWTDTSDAAAYARFNLGVALLRSGRAEEGRRWLESVGAMPATSAEQLALRDRGNLALGYAALQENDAASATVALERVRLDGPFTNQALLGLGWSELDAGRYDRALVPWLALRERPVLDASVQESMLAVPYAYVRLDAKAQAAEEYRKAIAVYAAETARLDESIAAIRAGGFLDSVLRAAPAPVEMSTFWRLQKLPDAPHTRYLYRLLATHEFQAGLGNYRDLRFMQRNLERWRDSLDAFAEAAAARAARAPRQSARVEEFTQRVDALLPRVADATQHAERALSGVAIAELEAQKRRLASYTAQAQFGLAALYDAAASGGGK